jgi:uncharacterized RDD family membrane protein YckC
MFKFFRKSSTASPTAKPQQWQPASLRRRLASMLYETLMILGVLGIAFMVPHLFIGVYLKATLPGWVLLLHVYLVLGAYFIWLWRHGGQSLSMRTWRVRLVRIGDNGAPSLSQCLLRYTLSWPSVLLYGVGLIWAFFDRDGQFLHDRLSGTRLVYFDHQLP